MPKLLTSASPMPGRSKLPSTGLKRTASRAVQWLDETLPKTPRLDDAFNAIKYYRAHQRLPRALTDPAATYNDFIMARMAANDWSDLERRLIDKAEVKTFAAQACLDVKTPRTIAVIEMDEVADVADLDRRLLAFWGKPLVFKPTHSSGSVVFARKGRDESALRQLFKAAQLDFYRVSRESQYKGLARRIIVEEELSQGGQAPWDYKFFCACGKVLFIQVDTGRFDDHRRAVFNADFQKMDIKVKFDHPLERIDKPETFALMSHIAQTLSSSFQFVRVDLYTLNGDVYLGEMTFAPEGGTGSLSDESFGIDVLQKMRAACREHEARSNSQSNRLACTGRDNTSAGQLSS